MATTVTRISLPNSGKSEAACERETLYTRNTEWKRDSRGHALMQSQRGAGETRARPLQETQFGGGTTKSESRALFRRGIESTEDAFMHVYSSHWFHLKSRLARWTV